jgi:hypothetical protein
MTPGGDSNRSAAVGNYHLTNQRWMGESSTEGSVLARTDTPTLTSAAIGCRQPLPDGMAQLHNAWLGAEFEFGAERPAEFHFEPRATLTYVAG